MNDEQRSYLRLTPGFLRLAAAALLLVLPFATVLPACKDRGKESAARANDDTTALAQLVLTDVSEIERGLPLGAAKFAPLFAQGASDELKDPNVLKKQLIATRRQIPDLVVAKSTFFALADDKGVALRNDLETDVMAGTNLVSIFPALAPALQGTYVETSGGFPQTKKNNDRDWVAAAPLKRADGSVGGLYLTGWTYRTFARHLLEARKHDITEELRAAGKNGQMPIEYIGVLRSGRRVHGAAHASRRRASAGDVEPDGCHRQRSGERHAHAHRPRVRVVGHPDTEARSASRGRRVAQRALATGGRRAKKTRCVVPLRLRPRYSRWRCRVLQRSISAPTRSVCGSSRQRRMVRPRGRRSPACALRCVSAARCSSPAS